MKLNNRQITALARQIQENLGKANKSAHEKKVADFKKTARYINCMKKYKSILDTIPPELLKSLLSSYSSTPKEQIVEQAMNKDMPKSPDYPSEYEIENQIVLASVDSTTMDELIRKLPAKYKIK